MQKIKQTGSFFYEQFYKYLLYIAKHPFHAILLLLGIWAGFGSFAFATDYYVDSEVVINIAGTNYNWLEIGRFGLVFVRKLLQTSWYNPYYTGILFLFFLWLAGMSFMYLCSKLFPKLPPFILTLGSLIFLTYPTFTEQYYFHFQAAEVAFGLWLCMLALGGFYLFVRDKRWSCFFITLPLVFLVFGIYQSFVPLMLCGYLAVFLNIITKEAVCTFQIRRGILGSIAHFFTAFISYELIDTLFFADSSYLSDQIIWSSSETGSLITSIKTILLCCMRMLIGYDIFYTAILLFAILFATAACWNLRNLPTWQLVLSILSGIGITICPFLLTLLMGGNTATRSQFTYGLSAVFLIFFGIQAFLENASFKLYLNRHLSAISDSYMLLASVLLFIYTVFQIGTVRFIWNAHEDVTEFDRTTATAVMETLYDSFIVNDGVGTVLWGSIQPESEYDELLLRTPSYLFYSVFNLEHHMEPYCYYSTIRVLGYMESMGHTFTLPNNSVYSVSRFIMNRENLAAFPQEGCYFNDSQAYTLNLGNCPAYYYN